MLQYASGDFWWGMSFPTDNDTDRDCPRPWWLRATAPWSFNPLCYNLSIDVGTPKCFVSLKVTRIKVRRDFWTAESWYLCFFLRFSGCWIFEAGALYFNIKKLGAAKAIWWCPFCCHWPRSTGHCAWCKVQPGIFSQLQPIPFGNGTLELCKKVDHQGFS